MSLFDILPDPPDHPNCLYGKVAKTVDDVTDDLFVILPDFHEHYMWGPCRWQTRGADGTATPMPVKNDEVLLMFDNRRQPWVVAWWPFT